MLISKIPNWDNRGVIITVAIFRVICLLIWTGTIAYGTYALYLASKEFPPYRTKQVEAHNSSSSLMNFLELRRESLEYGYDEWDFYLRVFMLKMGYWLIVYVLISYVLAKSPVQSRMLMSVMMTAGMSVHLMGCKNILFIFLQTGFYYILMVRYRSRIIIWTFTILLLWLTGRDWFFSSFVITGDEDWDLLQFLFQVMVGWNCLRCLSYCFDNWDVPQPSLWNLLTYCFYFPTAYTGPIVLYATFQRDILHQQGHRRPLKSLFGKLIYIGFIIFLCETIPHMIHFRRLAWNPYILKRLNLWASAGIMFWFGQFFMLKYMVMYGIPKYVAEYEGLEMPPLPKCPSHIHRYSVLWKEFDRGLFNFLVKYTYVPTIQSLENTQYAFARSLNPELKKLVASISTFCFVYSWHGFAREVLIWTFYNFIGITIERIGTSMKRRIESRIKVDDMTWDFILEPIFTIPLAAMSLLNSVVFLANEEAANIFTHRFCSTCFQSYVIPIMFCLTHVAVTFRTLPTFWPKLMGACFQSQR